MANGLKRWVWVGMLAPALGFAVGCKTEAKKDATLAQSDVTNSDVQSDRPETATDPLDTSMDTQSEMETPEMGAGTGGSGAAKGDAGTPRMDEGMGGSGVYGTESDPGTGGAGAKGKPDAGSMYEPGTGGSGMDMGTGTGGSDTLPESQSTDTQSGSGGSGSQMNDDTGSEM